MERAILAISSKDSLQALLQARIYFELEFRAQTTLNTSLLLRTLMQDEIFNMLLKEEEIGWKAILLDLVQSEKMDPWDVNITLLTQKYIQVIKEMKEHDLKISGKMILAAAILLKLKTTHLIEKDITRLDRFFTNDDSLQDLEEEIDFGSDGQTKLKEKYPLIPRNPQARNRKVSINDLVKALQHALETKRKILQKMRPVKFNLPSRKIDIMEVIRDVYHKLEYYTQKEGGERVSFTKLIPPRATRLEKVFTFVPLLHLENHHRIEMEQQKPFDEIYVTLLKPKKGKEAESY